MYMRFRAREPLHARSPRPNRRAADAPEVAPEPPVEREQLSEGAIRRSVPTIATGRYVDGWTLTPLWGKRTQASCKVVVTRQARKDLRSTPVQVQAKFRTWVDTVERVGLEETRKVPGFHDEPLKGKLEGGRSIRLNDAYRAY